LFFEEHIEDSTSWGLEVKRPEDGKWKVEWSSNLAQDAASSAEEVYKVAIDFVAECPDGLYRALCRIKDEDGHAERVRCSFHVPKRGMAHANPIPMQMVEENPGMAFVLQVMENERERTERQLEVSTEREDRYFDAITTMIEETRKDRESHDKRMEPLMDVAVNTLTAAASLVQIHQENTTQVQLAKLEAQTAKENMEMYLTFGGPMLKAFAKKFGKRKSKKTQVQAVMPIDPNQEDSPPPKIGPTRTLFMIFEQLTDEQIDQVTAVLPDGMFERLDNAAHGGDDAKTTVALGELKGAYEKLGKLQGLLKLAELGTILGEDLSDKFIALFEGDHEITTPSDEPDEDDDEDDDDGDEADEEVEDKSPVVDQKILAARKKGGYVKGLRDANLHQLDEPTQIKLAEQLGAPLTGVLVAAAEGDDEDKAFAALCTFAARMQELAEETSTDDAEKRMLCVIEILGDDERTLIDMLNRIGEELSPD
jgi:hypothetical protein